MTAQETSLLNAYETTLTGTIGASDLTFTVNSVTDSASNTLTAPCYLILNPDSATNREVVLVTSINAGTKTLTLDNINKRYLTGSAATSGLSHASGSVVRMSPVQQHIEDINDRVDTIINEAGTAVNTTLFLDEDDMVSDSATKGVTQQSVKAYVDSQVTAQDLDFGGDSGTGAVDLDSQTFTIAGTANEIETSALNQTITIGLPTTITTTLSGTSVLSDGVTATTQSASDNSTKVATTAYVDAQVTAEDLDFGGDTGTGSVDLDSQTFTIAGTTNEIETSATGQTLTIGLPSSITVNVTGALTGNASTATALETARTIAGVSFDGTANIDIPINNLSDVVITTPSTGQVLEYNGTNWVNATDDNTEYTAGDGLDLTGTTFSTDLKANGGLVIESTELALDLGASSITGSLDAAKIADGSVSDTEFQYLNGVTSAIQTQLDGKQASGAYITASSTDTLTNKTLGAVTLSGTVTGGDQEINAVVLKDYAETDVAVTSSSGVVSINLANGNTGSITLTENITDIDFTNVPTNGVSTFTLQITQHASSAKTVAINAVTVNGGGDVTAKTAGGGGYTVSSGASAIDLVTFLFLDAGTPLLNALQDFS